MGVSDLVKILKINENRSYFVRLLFYTARTLTKRSPFRVKTAAAVLFPWKYRKFVPHIMLQVCSQCQNRCNYCSQGDLMAANLGYQLSMDELETFIRQTEESKYFIENVLINGPGEPTLWKHFNEGVRRLYKSPAIGNIQLTTNGQSLDRVDNMTWQYFSRVVVSVYPSNKITTFDGLKSMSRRYGFRLMCYNQVTFRVPPKQAYPNSLPAQCNCHGPMVYGNRVYPYCGPTGFGAAVLKGEPFLNSPKHSREMGFDYLAGIDKSVLYHGETLAPIKMDLCRYCISNENIPYVRVPHEQTRDRYVTITKR